ncbi:MAG: hypothetical protein ACTSUF_03750 [Candidatus Heimdallarchaeaceae archaeon]
MPLTAEEIPKLIVLFIALGLTSYMTVWLAGQVRSQITAVLK